MKKKIYSKEDIFKLLDAELSAEEKTELATAESISAYHFSLGVWIRNTLIYNNENNIARIFSSNDSQDTTSYFPSFLLADTLSSTILEEYQKYLQH